eukprot:5249544-Heterocapsa_arctica.AAC.1
MHFIQAADCLIRPELRAAALDDPGAHTTGHALRPFEVGCGQLRVRQGARKKVPAHRHHGHEE